MIRTLTRLVVLALLSSAAASGMAAAHAVDAPGGASLTTWSWEPWAVTPLVLSAGLYGAGLVRLRARSRSGAVEHGVRAALFALGWLVTAVALVSPVDPIGGELFSMHMMQHELLMLIAAPALVLSRPGGVFAWGLPWTGRRALGPLTGGLRTAWRMATRPLPAWAWHFAVLWGWHVPWLFEAGLHSDLMHALQHLCFVLVALVFWRSVFRADAGVGAAVFSLFTTAIHATILGAMLTLAPSVWYPTYLVAAPRWGLTPLEDQQLGGLIMWVPGGIVYVVAGLAILALALNRGEPSSRRGPGTADLVRVRP
ncbi:MAG: cytochrome c oxidase assembly protein [Acetobacterales bacterium]